MFDQTLKEGLMKALEFAPQDLEANRNGMMSEAQKARLGKMAGMTRVMSLFMFVVVILVFAGIGAYLFVFTDSGKGILTSFSKEPSTLYIVGGVLAVVVLIILLSFARTLASTSAASSGKVSVAEGPAKVRASSGGYGMTSYTIKIGKAKFYVTEPVFNSFAENQTYRVYYIKNSPINTMLSAEML